MKRGKSFKQWQKEVENGIANLGYSPEYANATMWGLRSRYHDKYNYQPPENTVDDFRRGVTFH